MLSGVLLIGSALQVPVPPLPPSTDGLPNQGGEPMPPEADIVRYGIQQGGLVLLLILGAIMYRKDFQRKVENVQADLSAALEDKRALASILASNAEANTRQAIAVNENTSATRSLTSAIDRLSERRAAQS